MLGGCAWCASLDVLQQLLDEPLYFTELAHNWVEVQSSCQAFAGPLWTEGPFIVGRHAPDRFKGHAGPVFYPSEQAKYT